MQHDHVLKKFNLNLFTPKVGEGGGGGPGIIVAIHVAAPVTHYKLICNIIMF